MQQQVEAAQAAHRLWKSDSTAETIAAIVVVVAAIGIPLYQAYQSR